MKIISSTVFVNPYRDLAAEEEKQQDEARLKVLRNLCCDAPSRHRNRDRIDVLCFRRKKLRSGGTKGSLGCGTATLQRRWEGKVSRCGLLARGASGRLLVGLRWRRSSISSPEAPCFCSSWWRRGKIPARGEDESKGRGGERPPPRQAGAAVLPRPSFEVSLSSQAAEIRDEGQPKKKVPKTTGYGNFNAW